MVAAFDPLIFAACDPLIVGTFDPDGRESKCKNANSTYTHTQMGQQKPGVTISLFPSKIQITVMRREGASLSGRVVAD